MYLTNFQTAIKFVLEKEGGYVFDKTDPGGETNYGISKRAHPNENIKNLTLARAIEIYKEHYWDFYKLDDFVLPLCICLMDAYVQHRPSVVAQLRKIAGGDWKLFNASRREFYLRLIQKSPALKKFQKGWMNRMNSLDKYCDIIIQDLT